jgi:glycerate dehydrogenase
MKIVVLDGGSLRADGLTWAPLAELGEVELYDFSAPEEVPARSCAANILVLNKAAVTAQVISEAPHLRYITVTATGYDCVDGAAARQRSIPVSNVPEYGTDSVAQFVFAHLLEHCHHVALHDQAVRDGEWARAKEFCFWKKPQIELVGKVMGIVGFGRIGRRVGELAHAFGMAVLANDQYRPAAPSYQPFAWAEMDEVFTRADVISLHCPLTPETTGLVNSRRLQLVKPTAFLINAARGPLVVEVDLAEALNQGRLAGAAVDVVSREPMSIDNLLLKARNCAITPHIAWATREARQRLLDSTVANVAAFLAGKPVNVVN